MSLTSGLVGLNVQRFKRYSVLQSESGRVCSDQQRRSSPWLCGCDACGFNNLWGSDGMKANTISAEEIRPTPPPPATGLSISGSFLWKVFPSFLLLFFLNIPLTKLKFSPSSKWNELCWLEGREWTRLLKKHSTEANYWGHVLAMTKSQISSARSLPCCSLFCTQRLPPPSSFPSVT